MYMIMCSTTRRGQHCGGVDMSIVWPDRVVVYRSPAIRDRMPPTQGQPISIIWAVWLYSPDDALTCAFTTHHYCTCTYMLVQSHRITRCRHVQQIAGVRSHRW
jgi:hypothetical protein